MQAWIWRCLALLLAPLALAEDRKSARQTSPNLILPLPHARNGGQPNPTPQVLERNIHLPSTFPPDEPSLPASPMPSTESATKDPASTPRPDLVGIRGYRRFHANDSLIGRPIGCTHEEKLCFKYNLLYNRDYNGCYRVGHRLNPQGDINVGELQEFTNGSSRLNGIEYTDFCDGYRMAFDDICYEQDVVRRYICGCDADPTWHILGGQECRCTHPTPIRVEQPAEEGKCRIPDLRLPEDTFPYFQNTSSDVQGFILKGLRSQTSTSQFACTSEQMECFSKNKVWMPEAKGCFPLLERGPCAEEHLVALDVHAVKEGRAEGTCVHVQGGCPQGHVRMGFDGECHNADDVMISVVGELVRDPFGMFAVFPRFRYSFRFVLSKKAPVFNAPESHVDDSCFLTAFVTRYGFAIAVPSRPKCGANNKNVCARYEVVDEIPTPELE